MKTQKQHIISTLRIMSFKKSLMIKWVNDSSIDFIWHHNLTSLKKVFLGIHEYFERPHYKFAMTTCIWFPSKNQLCNFIKYTLCLNFVNGSQWAIMAKCSPKITMFEMILGMDLGLLQWVAWVSWLYIKR